MDDEKFFHGYCRQADGIRTVSVYKENSELQECDCLYETCIYAKQCTIGKEITDWLKRE